MIKRQPLRDITPRPLRAIGLSNWVYDRTTKTRYSVQFYDFDFVDKNRILNTVIDEILSIFPYDVLMYETSHGIHFISFSLLKGCFAPRARCIELTKKLDKQDYWTSAKDLTLRVSEKWKPTLFGNYRIVSERPRFKGVCRNPNAYIISNKHLEFYRDFMNLPDWVYHLYDDCDKRNYRIKIYHYKTRG